MISFLFDKHDNLLYILGLVYFPLLYVAVHGLLSRLLPPRYADAYALTLSMRLVGSLQSLAACVCGFRIVWSCRGDVMNDGCWLTNAFAKFCTCYFFVDLYVMYLSFVELKRSRVSEKKEPHAREPNVGFIDRTTIGDDARDFFAENKLMTFHHLVLPVVFVPCVVMRDGRGDFFIGALYLVEASNPLVNLRAVLRLLECHRTRLYFINGVAMMVVFFLCRIAIFPFLYCAYATYAGISVIAVPTAIPLKCNFGCLLLLSMQCYWFVKMVAGMMRILRSHFGRTRGA